MQISDSGFRWEINVVSPGDSPKRASLRRRTGPSRARPTKEAWPSSM